MPRRAKIRRKNIIFKPRDTIVLIGILIFCCTTIIIIKFNNLVTPNILIAADMKINSMTHAVIHKSFEKEIINNNINNILIFDMNEDEISGVNFDMEKIYEMARNVTNEFNKNINYIENGQWDKVGYNDVDAIKSDSGYILSFPVGIASKNVFLANLGPRIPVKIRWLGTTLNEVETKITSYGINNALVEVFISMDIERQIITPVVSERDKKNYKLLLSSKIIYGKVPNFYNGLMNKSTNLNIPLY